MSSVLTGARIPEELWETIKSMCKKHGLKLSYFVTQALEEKLQELKDDEEDIAIIKAREDEPSIPFSEMEKYFKSRGLNV